jgi:hypothetical protein
MFEIMSRRHATADGANGLFFVGGLVTWVSRYAVVLSVKAVRLQQVVNECSNSEILCD